jgi:flagellar hook-associated protein 2
MSSTTSSISSTSGINVSSILQAASGSSSGGIDVSAAVAAALYADRATERVWQSEQTTLTSQKTDLTNIQAATEALGNDLSNLNSLTGPMASRIVTSSNSNYVTASAAAGTTAGTHTVNVNSLAATASWYSDSASSPTANLPATSFTLTTASGSSATINVGSNGVNTLNDVATAINNQNLGVTASVISDASGSRLAIISATSGSSGDFSITSSNDTTTSWSSPDFTSGQTFGANSFTIAMNGTTSTINTTSGETLSQVASDINGQSLGVTASVVSDSNGSHLQIVSTDGSTPFTISEPAFGFSQAVQGANASITVDGVPVSSTTNKVTGAIPGVTINLLGATSGSNISLTVGADTSSMSSAIGQFVTDYNSAIGLVDNEFTYSSGTSSQGVLSSDSTVRNLQQTLQSLLNYVATPASGTTTSVSTLSSLGISINSDGSLSLDSGTLNDALTNSATDVQNFFMGSALNGFAANVTSQLGVYTNPGSGAFTVDLNSMTTSYNDLASQISDYESMYIANQQTLLTTMYSNAEAALEALPTKMSQIQAELGNNNNSNN